MRGGGHRSSGPGGDDELFAGVIIAGGVASLAVWAGAQVASLVSSGRWLNATVADGLGALVRLPGNASNPAAAWPADAEATLPGPVLYWAATIAVLGVLVGVAAWLWLCFAGPNVGTRRRRRLGVRVGARLAMLEDLAPLVVSGPTRGGLIFGTAGRRMLATETKRSATSTRRATPKRQGGRSALAVIGPSQSGKTATVVAGILDWDGPAVLSSVKNDLFGGTVARRLQLGGVYVFDPMRTIPHLPPEVKRGRVVPAARCPDGFRRD